MGGKTGIKNGKNMKKLFGLFLMAAMLVMVNAPINELSAQKNLVTITPTISAGVATYPLGALIGKAPMQIQFLDSATGTFTDPAAVYALPQSYTFTLTHAKQDQGWLNALLYYQKNQSALGTISLPQYYTWQAYDTITTKSRYTSLQVLYR